MFGLVAGLAFFLEFGNGANFALVPHVHPASNGVITGAVGATGDLGGIIFLVISRYTGDNYGRLFWIMGIITVAVNVLLLVIRPIPAKQLGGR